jgi:tetrahydromethanopterin S-methyltransferase subunit G
MDHLYEGQIVSRAFYRAVGGSLDWFDRRIVDNVAEFSGWFSRNIGRAISISQTGQVQGYAVGISVGVALIIAAYLIWGS